jgi:hypothetical protein
MKILFNGDSNMSGEEVAADESIAFHIEQSIKSQIGTSESVNLALTGASNDYIYDTTIEYLKNNTPDLVIIGWSDSGRMQWFNKNTGGMMEMNAIEVHKYDRENKNNDEYFRRSSLLKDRMNFTSEYASHLTLYWHNKIFNLHTMLDYMGIKHLFFSAFPMFNARTIPGEYALNWEQGFFKPYEMSYIAWCTQNNYCQITEGWWHFEPAAQKAWADEIFKYINPRHITDWIKQNQ